MSWSPMPGMSLLTLSLLMCLSAASAEVPGEKAALSPQQIESEWLSPEALRQVSYALDGQARKATPEKDAIGGCDGIKNGAYGFHTDWENGPWWQVDLGHRTVLDRVLLYNRCDGASADLNSKIRVLVSDDGRDFKLAYDYHGPKFLGQPDHKPLVVALKGAQARYVRLQKSEPGRFYLDEVEVFAVGGARNVALGQPAMQSSVSQWSVTHEGVFPRPDKEVTANVIARGLRLAEQLQRAGADADPLAEKLRRIGEQLRQLPANAEQAAWRRLYLEARWTVRSLALRNPLLDFDSILFVKSAPSQFPHMSDQHYGWWSRPGGGVFILEHFKQPKPKLRCLTSDMPEGSYLWPDLSYDGQKILFAYCRYDPHVAGIADKLKKAEIPEDAFYHLFEMNLDGSGRRQLTRGRYDDFDGRYLPNGEIIFLSTRKGRSLQVSQTNTEATLKVDLPDSYVRCGGDNFRPVSNYSLHRMDARGGNLRPISAFESFEYAPSVADDGRILYTRWDYIDRFNGDGFSLWSANPDGTNPQLVYGNFTSRPQVKLEGRSIPGSSKIIFTGAAHHSITGGTLLLLDRNRGTEGLDPLTRLTPEVPFPETEAWGETYYANPLPLSEEYYLVGWSNRKLPPHGFYPDPQQNPVNAMGLYLYDAFGNLTPLYRDPALSCGNPIPVRPRPKPPVRADSYAWGQAPDPQEGLFLLQDVYQGLPGIARGTVKQLRIIAVCPKTQPQMNTPMLGVSSEEPGKYLLGAVPVEEDGSAYFRVPSGIPLFFQALDREGLAIQTMRSLTYVWPKQTLACIGCHESRQVAPPTTSRFALAAQKPPSKITPGPEGTWPLRFDRLVQPVLNQSCIRCHRPGSADAKAARFDLTAARAYENLLSFDHKNLYQLTYERVQSIAGQCPARNSSLLAMLRDVKGHQGLHLDGASLNRLATWMDLYAQRQGSFCAEQEKELESLKQKLKPLLVAQ